MSTTEDRKERQVYELGYLILPSIAEESLSDVVNAIKGIIQKVGGQEIASEDPLHIDLAYTMEKVVSARKYVVNEAFLGWIKFEADAEAVSEVSEAVRKLDEVLRSLLIKAPRETAFTFAAALKAKEDQEKEAEAAKQTPAPEVGKVQEKVLE